MLIEIHAIQNHSPANLNRDDLGAPKTCVFGGVLRTRISSQCLKRSIRRSPHFEVLCGGVRTRQLLDLIAAEVGGKSSARKRAEKVLEKCGFKSRKGRGADMEADETRDAEKSKMLVYTTREAVSEMAALLRDEARSEDDLARDFCRLIAEKTTVPDMALSGRMLEPDKSAKDLWKQLDTTVDAALQAAHAISTHEARPEVDYYVAADDIPGEDAGAGYLDEALFASACFYKYFSIHWETLVENLKGNAPLAAHTLGAFLRASALVTPSGKQNSFAAHNPPEGILVEVRDGTPLSYANAFARPVDRGESDLVGRSIAQFGQYVRDLDVGYGKPRDRFWFSPNLRHALTAVEDGREVPVAERSIKSFDELVSAVVSVTGHDWTAVRQVVAEEGAAR